MVSAWAILLKLFNEKLEENYKENIMGIGNIANSGMKAAMSNMDVISNNIANANTIGFKKSYINFADIYPSGNASAGFQAGLGVSVSSINQDFSPGGYSLTALPYDLSINKGGFFITRDPTSGQVAYTRAGRFNLNQGYFTSVNGNQRLQGYAAVNNTIPPGSGIGDITINSASIPAQASTKADITLNLDANSVVPSTVFDPNDQTSFNYQSSVNIYDSLGNQHVVKSYYVKTAANNWDVNVYVDGTSVGTGTLQFTTAGSLSAATGLSALSYSPTTGATSPQTFALNMGTSTQFGNPNNVVSTTPDGYPAGDFTSAEIDKNGMVYMQYSNSQKILAGQLALANFQSPQNLSNIGDSSWTANSASGEPIVNQSNAVGNINVGQLELSNVDLTTEMVSLINAQHTFQANAQVEQTFSEVMQTIIQL